MHIPKFLNSLLRPKRSAKVHPSGGPAGAPSVGAGAPGQSAAGLRARLAAALEPVEHRSYRSQSHESDSLDLSDILFEENKAVTKNNSLDDQSSRLTASGAAQFSFSEISFKESVDGIGGANQDDNIAKLKAFVNGVAFEVEQYAVRAAMVDNDRVRAEEISRANAFVASAMSTIPDADRSIVTAEMKRMDAAVKLLNVIAKHPVNQKTCNVYVKSWLKLANNAATHAAEVDDKKTQRKAIAYIRHCAILAEKASKFAPKDTKSGNAVYSPDAFVELIKLVEGFSGMDSYALWHIGVNEAVEDVKKYRVMIDKADDDLNKANAEFKKYRRMLYSSDRARYLVASASQGDAVVLQSPREAMIQAKGNTKEMRHRFHLARAKVQSGIDFLKLIQKKCSGVEGRGNTRAEARSGDVAGARV